MEELHIPFCFAPQHNQAALLQASAPGRKRVQHAGARAGLTFVSWSRCRHSAVQLLRGYPRHQLKVSVTPFS